jgi:hypothetical protein
MSADTRYELAPDLVFLAPNSLKLSFSERRDSATGTDTQSALKFAYLCKATNIDAPLAVFEESVRSSLHKRYARLDAPMSVPANGSGWSGQMKIYKAGQDPQLVRVVLTLISLPHPSDSTLRRDLALLVEVPQSTYEQKPSWYRRLIEERLHYLGASGATRASELTLAPIELEAPPPTPPPPAPSPSPAASNAAARPASARASAAPVARPSAAKRTGRTPVIAEETLSDESRLEDVAHGQRTVVLSIVGGFILSAMSRGQVIPALPLMLLGIALMLFAIHGVLRLASGFDLGKWPKMALMLLSTVPLLSLLCWFVLSLRATKMLRAAGYQVGLFGAK